MDDFEEIFEDLEDPRTGNAKRHELHEILVIGFCTLLSGGETCADMALFGRSKREFLQEFLRLEQGIPSHDTFSRVFRLLDPGQFHAWFIGFMRQFSETCEGVVAIDGKTLRRSFDRAAAASPLHLVSAWAVDQRLVLGQLAVGDKSNEIVAVPKLLELLSLKGRIVTADAMSCQRKIAQQVIDQGADYVLALKGNQEMLHDDVRRFLDDPETALATASETDKGHGRIETRTAALTTDIAWLNESHDWPGLKAIGKITATREINGRTTVETRCYLLSQAFTPERFNAIVRSHWSIENQLHWVLDVVMDEDQARNRKDHGPENIALLIEGPGEFIQTNIVGTFTLLQEALRYWNGLEPSAWAKFRFHHISTDEVYGTLGTDGLFTETTPYAPNSSYSASKASSDHLVRAWRETYGLPTLVTNCSNNYGPYHFPEKLIPHMIIKGLAGESLPVYGDGQNIRDWLYVEDHARALTLVLEHGRIGETYNIGGRNERTNLHVVETICTLLDELAPSNRGSYHRLISFVADRPGHDRRYAIDASKLENELGWRAAKTFESGLAKTVQWFLQNRPWWQKILERGYKTERIGKLAGIF